MGGAAPDCGGVACGQGIWATKPFSTYVRNVKSSLLQNDKALSVQDFNVSNPGVQDDKQSRLRVSKMLEYPESW